MPEITFNQAKEFLNNITSEDKVAVIYHNDGDGFASGILFYDWCKNKNAVVEQFVFNFGNWDNETDLNKFNKILIADVAPGGIGEINLPLDKEILYTDHHPKREKIPDEILIYQTADQGYIPSSRTAGELTELKPWLSLVGTISDAGMFYPENEKFINKLLKKYGFSLEEFKQKVSVVITNFLVHFNKDLDRAFEILDKINSIEEIANLEKYSEPVENEIQKFVKEYKTKKEKIGGINYYYFEPKFPVKKPVINIISQEDNDAIYIFAVPEEDGGKLSISARNNSRRKNMPEILQAGITGLEESSAGGHAGAAGGTIPAKDIEKFKENIREFMKK